ncbi:thiamine diphosphokinase [Bacillus sp. N9]
MMETNKKTIHIMAGGPRHLIPDVFQENDQDTLWIGVDRGVIYLLDAGIRPNVAVGDFDSISAEEWTKICSQIQSVNRFKPEKDETDMELAIEWALTQNPDTIKIFGGTGGRSDHFLPTPLCSFHMNKNCRRQRLNSLIFKTRFLFFPGKYDVELDHEKNIFHFFL